MPAEPQRAHRPGEPSPFGCPDCGGDLWEYDSAGLLRFRCRTGHGYSPASLLACQSGAVDDALNEAFRALKEKEHMERRVARRAKEAGNGRALAYHEAAAGRAASAAASVLRLLLELRSGGEGAAC